jgi:hypothetical protein
MKPSNLARPCCSSLAFQRGACCVLVAGTLLLGGVPQAGARIQTPGAVTVGPFQSGAAVAYQEKIDKTRREAAAKSKKPEAKKTGTSWFARKKARKSGR